MDESQQVTIHAAPEMFSVTRAIAALRLPLYIIAVSLAALAALAVYDKLYGHPQKHANSPLETDNPGEAKTVRPGF